MTITRSAIEIWLIVNRKSNLNTSFLPANGELLMSCVTFTFSNIAIQKYLT